MNNEQDVIDTAITLFQKQNYKLIAQNYLFVSPYMQFGEGDLLLQHTETKNIITIECKFLDFNKTGKTAKTQRTKHRKKIKEQSIKHASYVKIQNPKKKVKAIAFTNESIIIVENSISLEKSIKTILHFVRENVQLTSTIRPKFIGIFKRIPRDVLKSYLKCKDFE